MGCTIYIKAYVDSCTLFRVSTKDNNTADRRLQIDVFALREGNRRSDLKNLGEIPRMENGTDVPIKEEFSKKTAVWKLMTNSES